MSEHPPLCVPGAARAHLDLVVDPAHRRARTLYVVLCDAEARPVLHVVVDDLPSRPDGAACRQVLDVFTTALAASDPTGWLLVGLTRPGPQAVTGVDRRWAGAARDAAAAKGLRLVGVFVLGRGSCRRVPLADAA